MLTDRPFTLFVLRTLIFRACEANKEDGKIVISGHSAIEINLQK